MANSLEVRLIDDLVVKAQRRVEETGKYSEKWVESYASEAVGIKVARFGFATFREMSLIGGDIDPALVSSVSGDTTPTSEDGQVIIDLLADQAQYMVAEQGAHSRLRVYSEASTAVAQESGRLVLGVVGESSGRADKVGSLAFVDAFGAVLERSEVAVAPSVLMQFEVERALP